MKLGVLEMGLSDEAEVLCCRVKDDRFDGLEGVVKPSGGSESTGVAGCISVCSSSGLPMCWFAVPLELREGVCREVGLDERRDGGGGDGAIVWERNWTWLVDSRGVELAVEVLVDVSAEVDPGEVRRGVDGAGEQSLMAEFA